MIVVVLLGLWACISLALAAWNLMHLYRVMGLDLGYRIWRSVLIIAVAVPFIGAVALIGVI